MENLDIFLLIGGGLFLVNFVTVIGGLFVIAKMLTNPIDRRIDRLEDSFKDELKQIRANQAKLETGQAKLETGQAKLETELTAIKNNQARLEAGQARFETKLDQFLARKN